MIKALKLVMNTGALLKFKSFIYSLSTGTNFKDVV